MFEINRSPSQNPPCGFPATGSSLILTTIVSIDIGAGDCWTCTSCPYLLSQIFGSVWFAQFTFSVNGLCFTSPLHINVSPFEWTLRSHKALPKLRLYYELIRLPVYHPSFLSLRLSASILLHAENIPDLPSSYSLLSLSYHGLRPRRRNTCQAVKFSSTFSIVFQTMNSVDLSSTVNISGLNPFTLADCGLITPAGGFTYFVASISAPYGNKLACPPLPVSDFNRLECVSFAWRTHRTFATTRHCK